MGKLNLSISLELVTKALESGAQRAKNALRSLQYQAVALAGAMGATASLSGLVRTMLETARQAGKAKIILRNVSQTAREYGDNLVFLRKLSSELGIDIIGATEAYAKLAGSANAANVSIEDQQKIFRNVSKAIAAFQLSGEESKLALMAITQMMAKGKVSAEELRRQLGERMPVAMEAMARAAEVKMDELDKLLKKGAINSRDVMAQFSEHLVGLIPSLDLDNLETDLGKLKNTFTGFTEKLGVYDAYRSIVKHTTSLIQSLQESWAGLVAFLSGLGGVLSAKPIASSYRRERDKIVQDAQRASEEYISVHKDRQRKEEQLAKADEVVAKKYDELQKAQDALADNAPNAKLQKRIDSYQSALVEEKRISEELSRSEARLQSLKSISPGGVLSTNTPVSEKFEREVSKLRGHLEEYKTLTEKKTRLESEILNAKSNGGKKSDISRLEKELNRANKAIAANDQAIANSRMRINQELTKAIELEEKRRVSLSEYRVRRQEAIAQQEAKIESDKNKQLTSLDAQRAKAQQALDAAREKQEKAMEEVTQAISQEKEKREEAVMQRFQSRYRSSLTAVKNMFRTAFSQIGSIIKSALSGLAIGAVTATIGWVITKMIELYNHSKQVKSMFADYKAEMQGVNVSTDSQIIKLNALYSLYEKNKNNVGERKKIEQEISSILGLQAGELDKQIAKYGTLGNYIKEISKLKLLDKRAEAYTDANVQAQNRQQEILKEIGASGASSFDVERALSLLNVHRLIGTKKYDSALSDWIKDNGSPTNEVKELARKFQPSAFGKNLGAEYSELSKVMQDSQANLEAVTKEITELKVALNGSNASTSGASTSVESDKKDKSPLQKATEKFIEGLKELDNQKKAGHFKGVQGESDYQTRLNELANRAKEEIGGILGSNAAHNKAYQQAQQILLSTDSKYTELRAEQAKEIAKQLRLQEQGVASERDVIRLRASHAKTELEYLLGKETLTETQRERIESLKSIIKQDGELANIDRYLQDSTLELSCIRKATGMKEQEYQLALARLYVDAMKRAAQAKDATDKERNDRVQKYGKKASENLPEPKYTPRDKTFDYSKTESQILLEDKEHLEQYIAKLEEANKHTGKWTQEIEYLISKAKTIDEAFKMSKVKEDIKELRKSISQTRMQGIKNVAQAAHNLQASFRSISEAFDPENEATSWERFFSVFNSVFQITDGILSMIEMLSTLKNLTTQLTAATESLNAMNKVKTAEEIAGAGSSAAAVTASSAAKAAANTVEAKTSMAAAGANIMKAHSWMPFVGVAIAGAMIGAMIATVARSGNSIPRYANGGIVPGTSYNGDRQLAYVNSGELILNTAQQGHLASALRGGQSKKIEVNVVGELRGKDVLKLVQSAERKANR